MSDQLNKDVGTVLSYIEHAIPRFESFRTDAKAAMARIETDAKLGLEINATLNRLEADLHEAIRDRDNARERAEVSDVVRANWETIESALVVAEVFTKTYREVRIRYVGAPEAGASTSYTRAKEALTALLGEPRTAPESTNVKSNQTTTPSGEGEEHGC